MINELREGIKISEDDIKTLFFILDSNKRGFITLSEIEELKNIPVITLRLKEFYKSRINKEMVKVLIYQLRILFLSLGKLKIMQYRFIK